MTRPARVRLAEDARRPRNGNPPLPESSFRQGRESLVPPHGETLGGRESRGTRTAPERPPCAFMRQRPSFPLMSSRHNHQDGFKTGFPPRQEAKGIYASRAVARHTKRKPAYRIPATSAAATSAGSGGGASAVTRKTREYESSCYSCVPGREAHANSGGKES